jgi:hypothetical protein
MWTTPYSAVINEDDKACIFDRFCRHHMFGRILLMTFRGDGLEQSGTLSPRRVVKRETGTIESLNGGDIRRGSGLQIRPLIVRKKLAPLAKSRKHSPGIQRNAFGDLLGGTPGNEDRWTHSLGTTA